MVSATTVQQETQLRQRINRFLGDRSSSHGPVRTLLDRFRSEGWSAFIFGGTLRDLMVKGASVIPRDIDIVVDGPSVSELSRALASYTKRHTRFGGLHLEVQGWLFDVWPARETWAFREGLVSFCGFSSLPATTFLNVEAVVASLSSRRGRPRTVYSRGFFEGMAQRLLEVNLEDNPYPALCVVRSLVTAARLDFRVGPRLAAYLTHHASKCDSDELIAVQRAHYGRVRAQPEELEHWLRHVTEEHRHSADRPISLPVCRARQLQFWSDPVTGR